MTVSVEVMQSNENNNANVQGCHADVANEQPITKPSARTPLHHHALDGKPTEIGEELTQPHAQQNMIAEDYPTCVAKEQPVAKASCNDGETSCHEGELCCAPINVPAEPERVACGDVARSADAAEAVDADTKSLRPFAAEDTFFLFDWDDTILPSSWVQGQGLRLDESSKVTESQRQQLVEVANAVAQTLLIAKEHGTVVFVTNAERGWIELSCQKFLPTLYPTLEDIKLLSARSTYESPALASPVEWKVCAFESEIQRFYGTGVAIETQRRKNILSLGDSINEREALHRATASLPNCRSKSLKFVEAPDIAQICKQHALVNSCFDRIVHHDGNLDLCIKCA